MKKLIFTILSVVFLLVSCSKKDDRQTIKIAYLPITHALPLVGLQQNDSLNVELVKYGSWPELLDALNTGRVDGASVLIELAMKAKAQGVGLTAVALGHTDGNIIVVSEELKDGSELRGKTFAIPHRASSHYILLQDALAKNGLTIENVNLVEMAPPEMPSALASGQIGGYCVAEPFGALGISVGKGKVLYRSEELWPNSICCGLVFNDKSLASKKDQIAKVIEAYYKSGQNLTDKDEALKQSKKLLSQSDDVLKQSLSWINYSDLKITESAYDSLSAKMTKYGILDKTPSYKEFVK